MQQGSQLHSSGSHKTEIEEELHPCRKVLYCTAPTYGVTQLDQPNNKLSYLIN